jgi:hypothetical protein
MLDYIIKILDLTIKIFAVIGIIALAISYLKILKIDHEIKERNKNLNGSFGGAMEQDLKSLREDRERIISKIPFLK